MTDFLSLIGTIIEAIIGWVGDVATMVVITPLFAFSFGVAAFFFVVRAVRRLTVGL
jgi:hypothetical protein